MHQTIVCEDSRKHGRRTGVHSQETQSSGGTWEGAGSKPSPLTSETDSDSLIDLLKQAACASNTGTHPPSNDTAKRTEYCGQSFVKQRSRRLLIFVSACYISRFDLVAHGTKLELDGSRWNHRIANPLNMNKFTQVYLGAPEGALQQPCWG